MKFFSRLKFKSRGVSLVSIATLLPALSLSLLLVTPTRADDAKSESYLRPLQPDGITLLTPPPATDSAEQAADLALARSVFKGRSDEELARALKDASLSIFNFSPVIGDFFKKDKFPKLERFFNQVKSNSTEIIDRPKAHWDRRRPYELDKDLLVGRAERNASYPSGHSTRGMLQGLMLAEIFPEKREAILEFGKTIGWDRVIIGKHFYTDVVAGRVLAQAIMRELMANENFNRDLAEVKKEVSNATKKD